MKNVLFWEKWAEKKPFLEKNTVKWGKIPFFIKIRKKFWKEMVLTKWKMCFLEKIHFLAKNMVKLGKMPFTVKFFGKNGLREKGGFLKKERVKKFIKCEKCAILEKIKFFG